MDKNSMTNNDELSWHELVDQLLQKLKVHFSERLLKTFQDFSELINNADSSDDAIASFLCNLIERQGVYPADEFDRTRLDVRHYSRQYIEMYFYQVVDTVFDFIDQCSCDCRVYLKNIVNDFLYTYIFNKE